MISELEMHEDMFFLGGMNVMAISCLDGLVV